MRTTEARDHRRGIPQGSPLSPLLANLYMRRFVLGWKKLGLEQSLGTRLVTYADDLVILCRRGSAENALHHLRGIMGKLKLTVNEDKTRICKVPEGHSGDIAVDADYGIPYPLVALFRQINFPSEPKVHIPGKVGH